MSDRSLRSRIRDGLRHAFALPSDRPFTDDERALIVRLTSTIKRREMQTPAILALESSRPLGTLAANATHALSPLLRGIVSPTDLEAATRLMQHPRTVDALIGALRDDESEIEERGQDDR